MIHSIYNIYSFKLHNVTKQKTIHWNGEGETNIQLPLNGTVIVIIQIGYKCFTISATVTFTAHPQGGVYIQGSAVSLTCAAASNCSGIQWVHNDSSLVSDASRTANGGLLNIIALTPRLSGSYRCLATCSGGAVTSAFALVQVAGEPLCAQHVGTQKPE